jgi:hypothetical protein
MVAAAFIAGGLLGAAGSMQQGSAAKKAAKYNSKMLEARAVDVIAQSKEEERRQRVIGRKQLGDIRASYAASGVTTEGSPLDILEESAASAELDALTIRRNGERQAMAFRNEAKLERMQGRASYNAGQIGAAATLLNAGAMAYKD